MRSARWTARLGLAGALIVGGGCIAVLAASAASERLMWRSQPGAQAPTFSLPVVGYPNATTSSFDLKAQRGHIVVAFFCALRCPVSNDYEQRVAALHQRYAKDERVRFVAIHTGVPAAEADDVTRESAASRLAFDNVIDTDSVLAKQYGVQRTPTFFVINAAGEIAYRGAFDDNRNADQASERYIETAIRQLLKGKPVTRPLTPVEGCPVR